MFILLAQLCTYGVGERKRTGRTREKIWLWKIWRVYLSLYVYVCDVQFILYEPVRTIETTTGNDRWTTWFYLHSEQSVAILILIHITHTHTTICVAEWKKYTVTRHDTKQCMQLYSHVPLCLCAFLPLPFPLSFFLRGMKEDDKFMPENKFRTFFVVARLISLAYHFQLIQSDMLWYWLIYVLWIL